MPVGDRLTACASSSHPEPAAAVGEVVGHLHETLAGSPQFALVLLDLAIDDYLTTVTRTLHRLLGPDLMLAASAPHISGGNDIATKGSLVVWALCGIDVAPDGRERAPEATGDHVLAFEQRDDDSVAVSITTQATASGSLFIDGGGSAWRPPNPGFVLPPDSAQIRRTVGDREVGLPMTVTRSRSRTVDRLDGEPAANVVIDRLDLPDGAVNGPSIGLPPLRFVIGGDPSRAPVEVVAVDSDDGSINLTEPVQDGERVQIVAFDPGTASRRLFDGIQSEVESDIADRAVLVAGHLDPIAHLASSPIPTATATGNDAADVGGAHMAARPWTALEAVTVRVGTDDL